MAFQSTVLPTIGAGIIGELAYEGPLRGVPAVLRSTSAANNVVGRAARIVSGMTGTPLAGDGGLNPKPLIVSCDVASAAAVFAGIIANPKVYAMYGVPLTGSLVLPNEEVVELITEGDVWVQFPAATNPGDIVYYLNADGTLVTTAPGAAAPGSSGTYAIGTVERFVNAAASIGVLHLPGPRVNAVSGH